MKVALKNKLLDFPSINLTGLNAQASYLKRKDRKFLLTEKQLIEVLNELPKKYQVLEIDKKRIFSYDNVYMDTSDYLFYHQHENLGMELPAEEAAWWLQTLQEAAPHTSEKLHVKDLENSYEKVVGDSFAELLASEEWNALRELGLIVV